MDYKKISVELVVFSEDADSIVSELNAALDRLDETHEIFGGAIETVHVAHSGTRRKSALMHAIGAGNTATSAIKLAAHRVADVYKKVV